MAGVVGFEPTPQGFGDPHATVTPDAYKNKTLTLSGKWN